MGNTIKPDVLEALKNGDSRAFETVFIAYFNKVKVFIDELIRSDQEAEELAQDLFIKLWVNRSSIDPGRSFSAYLYTMARNAAFNHIKHKQVESSYLQIQLPSPEEESGPEEQLYAKETALLIDMAVSKMPEQRRRIFEMSRYKGIPNEEIAEKLSISKKTVENQLTLVLKEIRRILS